jgi:hypothetical protein
MRYAEFGISEGLASNIANSKPLKIPHSEFP